MRCQSNLMTLILFQMKMEKKDLVTSINKLIKMGKLELKTQVSVCIVRCTDNCRGHGQNVDGISTL